MKPARIEKRITGGSGAPFRSVAAEIARAGGVEEEFLFEGVAAQFRLMHGTSDYPSDGRWLAEPMDERPFRSRMLVARPHRPEVFNGTVIVYWNNVSMGVDLAIEAQQAERLIEDGFALVGVTTQRAGIEGHPPDPKTSISPVRRRAGGIRGRDIGRYGSLHHPGDGFSYDIFTRAAELVGPRRPVFPIDPMGGLEVRHLVAMGASQSASRLATYVNAVQMLSNTFDAFLLNVFAGNPCALDPATAPPNLPKVGVNTFQLLPTSTFLLRADIGQPVIVLNSECEIEWYDRRYQPDTNHLRFWEIPGSGHFGYMDGEAMGQMLKNSTADVCRVSFAAANRAAIHGLHRWLEAGVAPAPQPRLRKQGDPSALQRDEHGNATGGIRWPDLEAPLALHVGMGPGEGLGRLMGRTVPFSSEKIRAIYGTRDRWFGQYREAVEDLVDTEVILPDDAARMLADASTFDVGI